MSGRTARFVVGALCVVLAIALSWWAVLTRDGQMLDAATLGATAGWRDALGEGAAWVRRGLPVALVAALGACAVLAFIRGRWREAVSALVFPAAAYAVTVIIRDVLIARPYLGDFAYRENTLPSGHMAVSVASAIAIAWLARRAPGWLFAPPVAVLLGAVGAVQVVTFAHRGADVVVAALVVGALGAVWPATRRPTTLPAVVLGSAVGCVILLVGSWLVWRWVDGGYADAAAAAASWGVATAAAGASVIAFMAGTCAVDARAARSTDT